MLYRGQREDKAAEDGDHHHHHREMYNASHQRLYCEAAPCDCPCPAASSNDVLAYIAPGDMTTSYSTCYARRPEVGRAEHAHEPGTVLTLHCVEDMDDRKVLLSGECTVLTLHCVEDMDASGQCECYRVVDARRSVDATSYSTEADRVDGKQLDLLRHDVAAASSSVI